MRGNETEKVLQKCRKKNAPQERNSLKDRILKLSVNF